MTQLSIKVSVAQWLERLPGNQNVIYFSEGQDEYCKLVFRFYI